jgi:hypothetical protein
MNAMSHPTTDTTTTTSPALLALAWALVGIPLLYGVWMTLQTAAALFTG